MTTPTTRRSLLKATAGAIGSVSLAGCMQLFSSSSTAQEGGSGGTQPSSEVTTALNPEAYAERFENVTNIVEDHGADPTGQEPIGDALSSAWSDDTLIFVPAGEYKMNRWFRRTGSRDVGLIGQNAVIRHGRVDAIDGHHVTRGEFRGNTNLFKLGIPSNPHRGQLVFGGFIFDWSAENSGMQGLTAHVDGTLEVRNILFHGMHDLGSHGNMRVATHSPESVGLVDSIDMRWGGKHYLNTINSRTTRRTPGQQDGPGASWSTSGITGHPEMQGTMHLNNVKCGGFPDNGIYIKGGGGRKILTNCHAANSGVASIRTDSGTEWEPVEYLDGTTDYDEARAGDYGRSVIENCVVEVDHTPDDQTYLSQRGIRIRNGSADIRNCHVRIGVDDGGGAGGGYAIGALYGTDAVSVENTSIELTEPGDAFYVTPGIDASLENIQIQTTGWNGSQRTVFTGATPSMEKISLNGKQIA